jgi:nucleotide-binding universal stress UspA family protein
VLPYAELVATQAGAALNLIAAVEIGGEVLAIINTIAYLDEKAAQVRSRSLSCSREVRSGEAADVILSMAETKSVDLITMSTHGRSGLKRLVLGSVAQKVLHGTTKPLLLVRAHEREGRPPAGIDRILVPLDGSRNSARVLPYVEELAETLGANLILYRCVPPLEIYAGTRPLDPGAGIAAATQAVDTTARLFDDGQSFLEQLAADIEERGGVKARCVVTVGHTIEEIVHVAEETEAHLIAMATHGHSGVKRWVMGSVADGVVRRSSLPCLLLRPESRSTRTTDL